MMAPSRPDPAVVVVFGAVFLVFVIVIAVLLAVGGA